MESIFDWSVILSIVGVLVIVTNIVVQVLKKLTWDKLPTNILAVLIAMALTLAAVSPTVKSRAWPSSGTRWWALWSWAFSWHTPPCLALIN